MFALLETPIQLVPDGTLLFHLVCIVAMVAIVNGTLLKPINRILEERQKRTEGRFSEAEQALMKAEGEWRNYERQLRDARSQGYSAMEQERAALSREREQKVSAVKAEVAGWLTAEKEKIKAAQEQAQAKLATDAQSTAIEISRHILNRSVG